MSSKTQRNKGWLLPNQIDPGDRMCVQFEAPDLPEYRAAIAGAIYELSKWWNWDKSYEPGDKRASETALLFRTSIFETLQFIEPSCDCEDQEDDPDEDDAPYWEDEDNVDGVSAVGEFFEWVADWVLTAFIAVTFTPQAAIIYRTFVPRARLAFRTGNWGMLVEILVDGVLALVVDTNSSTTEIIERDIDLIPFPEIEPGGGRVIEIRPVAAAAAAAGTFSNGDRPPGRIWKRLDAYAAASGIDVETAPRIEVVRKNIRATLPTNGDDDMEYRLEGDDCLLTLTEDGIPVSVVDITPCVDGLIDDTRTYPDPENPDRQPIDDMPPGFDKACAVANTVIKYWKDIYKTIEDGKQNSASIASIIAGVASIVAVVLGSVLSGGIALIAAAAAAINNLDSEVVDDVLTDDVWDEMVCDLYCRLRADGRLTQAGYDSLMQIWEERYSQVGIIGGIIGNLWGDVLKHIIDSGGGRQGVLGIRGLSIQSYDCSACDCDVWMAEWFEGGFNNSYPNTKFGGHGWLKLDDGTTFTANDLAGWAFNGPDREYAQLHGQLTLPVAVPVRRFFANPNASNRITHFSGYVRLKLSGAVVWEYEWHEDHASWVGSVVENVNTELIPDFDPNTMVDQVEIYALVHGNPGAFQPTPVIKVSAVRIYGADDTDLRDFYPWVT